ncbi:flagellar hook-associated protein FlgK [Algisphaera agarilytica]|uniref:Flagellar hook-associated protein 1 n=1 Tax=Algisphaera agarilytica TaxID=1385975 RepID=A0A7X0H9N8_9BACT|nr:flagellar hook-associated protein FlgK [Algisphaera agarilytica]MBB6430359.1 flagellar hook-associated protein 1 FlgK [Algisphaera agarilytica]
MGLSSSLNIGRTGLLAQQTAIEVTGNNLANLATPGYKVQRVDLSAIGDRRVAGDQYVGQGVQIEAITRQVSEAVEARLRTAIADQSAASATADQISRLEAVQNELTGRDLTTRLGEYFNAWSQLTTNPQDPSLRTLVTAEGTSLASFIQDLRSGYNDITAESTTALEEAVASADSILDRIESVNQAIAGKEGGAGQASALRDQRDQLLAELAQFLDVSTVEQNNGSIDVYVGSLPIILNGQSRGVELRTRTVDDEVLTEVVIKADGSALDVSSGELGARIEFINGDLKEAVESLDLITGQLIFETNRIHSQGQGTELIRDVTATNAVTDVTAALNDLTLTELPFTATNGSFEISVVSEATGQATTTVIDVDLDGINPATDTTLTSLAAALNAVTGVNASISPTGKLQISSDSANNRLSFSNDTSGVLAALGVNSFFTGEDAFDIAVNQTVLSDPSLLAAGQERLAGDNRNALALAALRDEPLTALNGLSVTRAWSRQVEEVGTNLAQARDDQEAFGVVRENLQGRQAAISGVNADEETINLLAYQRAYQASARFITVVDELTQTLLNLV